MTGEVEAWDYRKALTLPRLQRGPLPLPRGEGLMSPLFLALSHWERVG
jgi:hypothetical protein